MEIFLFHCSKRSGYRKEEKLVDGVLTRKSPLPWSPIKAWVSFSTTAAIQPWCAWNPWLPLLSIEPWSAWLPSGTLLAIKTRQLWRDLISLGPIKTIQAWGAGWVINTRSTCQVFNRPR